jgi:hypothetical protein
MKLFLDDMRKPPFGWERVLTADACIACIEVLSDQRYVRVEELSLDHDLHEEHYDTSRDPTTYQHKTGMAVVDWLANAHIDMWPAIVYVHSLNERARGEMVKRLKGYAPPEVQVIDKPSLY